MSSFQLKTATFQSKTATMTLKTFQPKEATVLLKTNVLLSIRNNNLDFKTNILLPIKNRNRRFENECPPVNLKIENVILKTNVAP